MDPDLRRYLDVTVALLVANLSLLVANTFGQGDVVALLVIGGALAPFAYFVVSLYLPAPEGAGSA